MTCAVEMAWDEADISCKFRKPKIKNPKAKGNHDWVNFKGFLDMTQLIDREIKWILSKKFQSAI
jgi:hypothetical protein